MPSPPGLPPAKQFAVCICHRRLYLHIIAIAISAPYPPKGGTFL